jgi:hypothetical protein
MCVTSGVSITRTMSSAIRDGKTSNNPPPAAAQHRDLIDLQLVQHRGFEHLLRQLAPCAKTSLSPAMAFACSIALLIPSVTYVTDG